MKTEHETMTECCPDCGKSFYSKSELTQHRKTHTDYPRHLSCDQCGYKASQKRTLSTHIKSKHEGVKFPCDQCDYKASQKGNLWTHIKSQHGGIEFNCDHCDYKASQKSHLLSHVKSQH